MTDGHQMEHLSRRIGPRLLLLSALVMALLAGIAPSASAEATVDDPSLGEAPAGATDGVPVGSWDSPAVEPVEGPRTADAAVPAAVPQRYFGADAFAAIQASAAAAPRTCGLSNSDLVAMILAPVFKESSGATTASSEPSPMTLSRYDEWNGSYPPPESNGSTNYGLYAFRDPYTSFPRAYWHPGIGIWQYDDGGVGMPFTAAERVDTGIMAADVGKEMARKYCTSTGSTAQAKRYWAWSPWGYPCTACESAYVEMTSTGFANLTLTDDVSATGGMIATTCAFKGQAGTIGCHFIDPSRAEGARWWLNTPDGGVPTSGVTPLSAPFYVFERNGYEERHWLTKDTGYPAEIWARRKMTANSRPRSNPPGSGLEWGVSSGLCDVSLPATCDSTQPPGTVVRSSIDDRGAAIPLIGNFDGDEHDDVFWYAAGSAIDDQWLSNGDATFSKRVMTVGGTYQPLVGDLDGNGRDDIFWYAPGAASDSIWWNGDKANSQVTGVTGSYTPLVADFDGNGRDEILWYAPGSVPDFVWSWSTDRRRSSRSQPVLGSYTPVLGDFDGDGATDLFWYAPGTASDHLWYGRSGGFDYFAVDVSGTYRPLVGDFDDDDHDDIVWYAAGGTPDYTWFGAGQGFASSRNDIFGTYEPFVVDLDPASASGGDDIIFYGPGSGPDVRWRGRTDRTFETVVEIDITGVYSPRVGQFAATDRGDILFWDRTGSSDSLWTS